MALCDILSVPFTLPKGFNPEGTKIVRCIDPELGVLRANDDEVFTFLIEKECGEIILFDSSVGSMKKIGEIKPNYYKILFASPFLLTPTHIVRRTSIEIYYNAMIAAWKNQSSLSAASSSTPSSASTSAMHRSFFTFEFMFNGEKCYRILHHPLKDILFYKVNGKNKVVGYKTCGGEVPKDLVDLIKNEYLSLIIDEDYIREAGFPEDNQGMAYGRDGKTYFKILSGMLKNVIREKTFDNDKVVGFKEIGRPLNGDLYVLIKSRHPDWSFETSILPSSLRGSTPSESSLVVLPPKYKSKVAYFEGVCYYRIVNTALEGIIYSIKSPVVGKKLIVGYQNLGHPPFPALVDLIKSRYPEFVFDESIVSPAASSASSTPSPSPPASATEFKVKKYGDFCHTYIITEGELKDVLLHMGNGKHVLGYRNPYSKLTKELFYKIYIEYGLEIASSAIPHPDGAKFIAHQNFGNPFTKIIFDGPLEGVVFRIEGDKNIVLGLGPRLQPLDRKLAAHIIFHHGDANFVVPDDVVEPIPLKFEPAAVVGFIEVTHGPLTGLYFAQRKRFWYASKYSAAELTSSQIELINKRYPMIVLP